MSLVCRACHPSRRHWLGVTLFGATAGVLSAEQHLCLGESALAVGFGSLHQRHYSRPHHGAAFVHVAVRVTHDGRVGAELESVEHDARGLTHDVLHSSDVGVQPIEAGADQHGVVDRRADLDALLGPQTASKAEHLGTIGLHREVAQANGRWRQPAPAPSSQTPYAGCPVSMA